MRFCLSIIAVSMINACLADTPVPVQQKTSLTVAPIMHTVECPNPKREICVIRKPVGAGYRLLTQGILLEDSGEYWLADFSKPSKGAEPVLAKMTFRAMGKDNDIHEIEISFPPGNGVKPPASAPRSKPPRSKPEKPGETSN